MVAFILIILGFALLIKGADFLVDGASSLAQKLHIPEIVIGLTIVSVGTSMPELFISITSAFEGHSDISIGNVIGSNIANLLLILGLSALVKPIFFQKETIRYEIPIGIAVTLIFYFFANSDRVITKVESMILLVNFALFILYTISLTKNKRNKIVVRNRTKYWLDIVLMVAGVVALKFGGDFVVENAIILAEKLKISEKIISVTVLALGTSLPELVTGVRAARKGKSDIAIGNIIGSNIFNILLVVGASAFISPVAYNTSYNREIIIFLASLFLLLVFATTKPVGKMSRWNGLIFLICYSVYIAMLFII